VQIRKVKNEVNNWQAAALSVDKFFGFDFNFYIANIVHAMDQIPVPLNVTSAIKSAVGKGRPILNQRVSQLDKLLDEERVALNDLDFALYVRKMVTEAHATFKTAKENAGVFYNSVKQSEAELMLVVLRNIKKTLVDMKVLMRYLY
jgi:hypothetical protein